MINYLHSLFHRPERGWDPVPLSHAQQWSAPERFPSAQIEALRPYIGELRGKTVLDLGAGAGDFSIAFAQAGAEVTWFDISHNYERIARRRAHESGVNLQFSVGYLEDAARLSRSFDLVFINLCWYYCMNDFRFARIVYSLVKPGGACYIASPWRSLKGISAARRIQSGLNRYLGIKIGHPFAPHRRIANLFHRLDLETLHVDYRDAQHDIVIFNKAK